MRRLIAAFWFTTAAAMLLPAGDHGQGVDATAATATIQLPEERRNLRKKEKSIDDKDKKKKGKKDKDGGSNLGNIVEKQRGKKHKKDRDDDKSWKRRDDYGEFEEDREEHRDNNKKKKKKKDSIDDDYENEFEQILDDLTDYEPDKDYSSTVSEGDGLIDILEHDQQTIDVAANAKNKQNDKGNKNKNDKGNKNKNDKDDKNKNDKGNKNKNDKGNKNKNDKGNKNKNDKGNKNKNDKGNKKKDDEYEYEYEYEEEARPFLPPPQNAGGQGSWPHRPFHDKWKDWPTSWDPTTWDHDKWWDWTWPISPENDYQPCRELEKQFNIVVDCQVNFIFPFIADRQIQFKIQGEPECVFLPDLREPLCGTPVFEGSVDFDDWLLTTSVAYETVRIGKIVFGDFKLEGTIRVNNPFARKLELEKGELLTLDDFFGPKFDDEPQSQRLRDYAGTGANNLANMRDYRTRPRPSEENGGLQQVGGGGSVIHETQGQMMDRGSMRGGGTSVFRDDNLRSYEDWIGISTGFNGGRNAGDFTGQQTTDFPSSSPSNAPTPFPSAMPSRAPVAAPSGQPSPAPTISPSGFPTISRPPTNSPSATPSISPVAAATPQPTGAPPTGFMIEFDNCDVTIGSVDCLSCGPCDNGGFLFDCSNVIPHLVINKNNCVNLQTVTSLRAPRGSIKVEVPEFLRLMDTRNL